MCLEWVAAIGNEENNASTRPEDTDHFADRGAIILDVFDYFVAKDQIKRRRRKRDGFACCINNVRRIDPSFGCALEVIFQSNDGTAERREMFHVHANTAPIFQDASFDT